MTEPHEDAPPEEQHEPNNLRPGPHDEGGHGGMATRELEAHQQDAADN
jgi:hypothetical protein